PADAMLGYRDVALVVEETIAAFDVRRHRAGQELVGIEELAAVPAAGAAEQRAEVVADDVEDLESGALAEAPLELEPRAAVVAPPDLAEVLERAVDLLVEGASRDVGERSGRQRPALRHVPDVSRRRLVVVEVHVLVRRMVSYPGDAGDGLAHHLFLDGEVP